MRRPLFSWIEAVEQRQLLKGTFHWPSNKFMPSMVAKFPANVVRVVLVVVILVLRRAQLQARTKEKRMARGRHFATVGSLPRSILLLTWKRSGT